MSSSASAGPGELRIVHLDAQLLRHRLGRDAPLGVWRARELGTPLLGRFVAAVEAAQAAASDDGDAALASVAVELVERALAGQAAGGLPDPRLTRVVDALHDEQALSWTIAGMARLAGMSPAHFSRSFARALGLPPMTYLLDLRVARAAWLMRDPARSLLQHQLEIQLDVPRELGQRLTHGLEAGRGHATSSVASPFFQLHGQSSSV